MLFREELVDPSVYVSREVGPINELFIARLREASDETVAYFL